MARKPSAKLHEALAQMSERDNARSVEIVPEAKPDYILRREKRQAFADLINAR